MNVENNQLRQKLLYKLNDYIVYCSKFKKTEDFFLCKEDIENGKIDKSHVYGYSDTKYDIKKEGCRFVPLFREEEELYISYYYNLFVYVMTHIIVCNLNRYKNNDKLHSIILESYKKLKKLSIINDIEIGGEAISYEWDYIYYLSFLHKNRFDYRGKATVKEMLEWMEVAESILKKEVKLAPLDSLIDGDREKGIEISSLRYKGKEQIAKERELLQLQEWETGKRITLNGFYRYDDLVDFKTRKNIILKEKEEEARKKEFEYNKQLKLGNRILILFFTALTAFVSYLAVGDGRMQEETFQSILNLAVIIAIPLMISIYYYSYRYKYIPSTDSQIKEIESSIKNKYSRKDRLKIFGIGLILFTAILLDYRAIFFAVVALIFVYGIYQAKKTVKNIDAEEMLFKEDVGIKDRIKKAIGTHIDIPYYGFEKVSDSVVDEVYHFFKDKKTEVEVAVRKIKDSEVPYETMDDESLVIMTEKYNKYDKLEKDGFAELQKIKAYGTVLERVLKEG